MSACAFAHGVVDACTVRLALLGVLVDLNLALATTTVNLVQSEVRQYYVPVLDLLRRLHTKFSEVTYQSYGFFYFTTAVPEG